ncbi:hypothetical protein GINT2_001191 [Glugoides intestinalis]
MRNSVLGSRIFVHDSDLASISSKSIASILKIDFNRVISILEQNLDEFSSELLFRLIKDNESILSPQLTALLCKLFVNILQIPLNSLCYLFDIYILLTIRFKQYNLSLIERIFNEEMFDFYNLTFLYISVLIMENAIQESFILQILSQDELWKSKDLHTGLAFIIIAAAKKQIISTEQAESASRLLSGYLRILILYKLSLQLPGEYIPEENYLINNIIDSTWFLENFMNKKYTRLVLKKLAKDQSIASEVRILIIEKNLRNVEYEFTLHSIIKFFDI